MTFGLTVSGSSAQPPYHPFSAAQAEKFDAAVQAFAAALKAAGVTGSISGSRPGTQAEYEARPRIQATGGEFLDTANTKVSVTF
jgi:hypothetical protein